MDKFIEITDIAGDKVLVNTAYIASVQEYQNIINGEFRYTQITLVGEHFLKTYERYEEIKKKIENAGKVFLTQDISYTRRSE